MSRISSICEWLLRRSVVWGGLACFAFYVLVVQNSSPDGALYRSFAGEGAALKSLISLLAFIGAAALAMRALAVTVQLGAVERFELPLAPVDGQSPDNLTGLVAEVDAIPRSLQDGYLARRLQRLLQFVGRASSADGLESEMNRLADADRRQAATSYTTQRSLVAAISLLGVLGVLTGAAAAVAAAAAPGAAPAGGAMTDGLNLAFGAASLALATAMLLVFARFGVERMETRLLAAIDESVHRQFGGRFQKFSGGGAGADPQVATLQRMCHKVLETVETAVERHDAALTKALTTAGRRWEETASAAAALVNRSVGDALTAGLATHAQSLNDGVAKHTADLEGTLIRHAEILGENIDQHTSSLTDALEHHTAVMTQTEQTLAAENRKHVAELEGALGEAMVVAATRQERLIKQSEDMLRDMQAALLESAGTAVAQQEQLIRQGDVLLKVVEATGQVRKLEEALNRNLASLAHAHHFEDTVVGLSAALQLLSVNLGRPLALRDEIDLDGEEPTSQAA